MYGNVGLPTARGSGTNGYIQRNLSFIKKKFNESFLIIMIVKEVYLNGDKKELNFKIC